MAGFSEDQIINELDALKSFRRRSLNTVVDPDLPLDPRSTPLPGLASSPPTSPTGEAVDLPLLARGTEGTSDADQPLPLSDLMWLPAHLHPDVAPQEFRAFLAEQTKPEALLRRSGSLERKRSMLSKQYTPSAADGIESPEEVSPVEGPSRKRDPLENLTIADLQKLEQLAVQAAQVGDKGDESQEQFRDLLRRSMSTGPATETVDADSQPLVQSPGGLIRRTARTKIRKPSLAGDGGGHRFGPSRRDRLRKESLDDGQISPLERQASFTDSDELHSEEVVTSPDKSPTKLRHSPVDLPRSPSPDLVTRDRLSPVASSSARPPARTPSPGTEERIEHVAKPATPPVAPPISVAPPPLSMPTPSTSKKSGWARLVSRNAMPKQEEVISPVDEDDTSSIASSSSRKSQKWNFFRSKSKEEGVRDIDLPSQMMVSPTASGMLNKNGRYTNFYRLPIHVERAVYRLSHIKLANPRRPLYEQVLISNLMFWYLGVINKPTSPISNEPPPRQASPVHIEEALHDQPPPLAKRPERSPAPILREPVPQKRESGFEVVRSRPSKGEEGAWLGTWPRSPSPVS